MIDEEAITRVIAVVLLFGGLLPVAALIGAIVWRFRGHAPGRRWGTAFGFGFGLSTGCFILLTEQVATERALTLALAGAVTMGLLWAGRRIQAGAFLLGCALPWTGLAAYYGWLLVVEGADFEPFTAWTMFAFGLVPSIAALALIAAGDPLPPEPSHMAPAGKPGSRRVGVVANAIVEPERIGPVPVSEVASFAATVVVVLGLGLLGLPFPLGPAVQVVAGTLAGNEIRIVARPRPARLAFEAFSWLGEWEFERVRTLTGRAVPTVPALARRWLRDVPDRPETRWLRVEILCLLGELDEARRVAATMPEVTPYDRFEKVFAFDLVDWMAGGDGDPEAVREAARELRPGDEETALRAEVALAVRETARAAAASGFAGAAAPLVRVRERLGTRADGQVRRALWRRALPISAATALVVWFFTYPFG